LQPGFSNKKTQGQRTTRPRKADGNPLANGAAGRSRRDAGIPIAMRMKSYSGFTSADGLRKMLKLPIARAGLTLPKRQGAFHLFCHTHGTWMTHYGDLDTFGLVRTGSWKNAESADRYNHTIASPRRGGQI